MATEFDQAVFFPVLVGVVRARPLPPGVVGPAEPDRVVVLNPLLGQAVVLPAGGAEDPLVAEVMRGALAAEAARGPPPASKAAIEALRTVEAEEGECAVCLGEMEGPVKEMPCRHRYHGGCISRWLAVNGTCPVCRYRLPALPWKNPTVGSEGEGGC